MSRGENVARKGTATQSSIVAGGATGGHAFRAIDGGVDMAASAGKDPLTGTHAFTSAEQDPWWEVDLGAELPLDLVNLWPAAQDTRSGSVRRGARRQAQGRVRPRRAAYRARARDRHARWRPDARRQRRRHGRAAATEGPRGRRRLHPLGIHARSGAAAGRDGRDSPPAAERLARERDRTAGRHGAGARAVDSVGRPYRAGVPRGRGLRSRTRDEAARGRSTGLHAGRSTSSSSASSASRRSPRR